MKQRRNTIPPIIFILLLLLFGSLAPLHKPPMGTAMAADKPKADKLALGEEEVKQLLLLMDTDKNGKISKEEFMQFMAAEFDRLDKDKSGELDPKELTQSRIRVTRHGGPIGR